ncbi:MAG: coiled-coil domain-containing protein [Aquificaceae bacterium]
MDLEKLAERLKDLILGELKKEFREFKAIVSGELAGFRLVAEPLNQRMASLEARQNNLEEELREVKRLLEYINQRIDETRTELKAEIAQNTQRIDEVNKRLDYTNMRIDETRAELKAEIMRVNQRIDEINKRLDYVYMELSHIKGDLNKALSQKKIIEDMLVRIQRLETKAFEPK